MLVKLMAFKQAYVDGFFKDQKGATAVEYGLIAGGISLAIVAALFLFGDELAALFSTLAGKMQEAGERAT